MKQRYRIPLELLLIVVLVISSISLPLPQLGAGVAGATGAIYTVDTTTDALGLGWPFQRHGFYTQDLHWVFYSDGVDIVFSTSSDAVTWSSATHVLDCNGSLGIPSLFNIWFDGTYVHYVWTEADYGDPIIYRSGIPNGNGTITDRVSGIEWGSNDVSGEQVAVEGNSTYNFFAPSVVVDSYGIAWVGYTQIHITDGDPTPDGSYVTKSEFGDGTWGTTPMDFPYRAQAGVYSSVSMVPLTNSKVFILYGNSTYTENATPLNGQAWNGSSWEAEVTTASNVGFVYYTSAVAFFDDVYIAFLGNVTGVYPWGNTSDIMFTKYAYDGNTLGSEVAVQTPANITSAPALSVNYASGMVYCYWIGSPDVDTIYQRRYAIPEDTWDDTVVWNTDTNIISNKFFTCFYDYTNDWTGVVWMTGAGSPYNIRYDPAPKQTIAWLTGWANTTCYRRAFTVDMSKFGNSTLTNFPITLILDSASGMAPQQDVATHLFGNITSNRYKIAVQGADGLQRYVEIEKWDYTGTPASSSAVLHFNSGNLQATGGTASYTFYLYYDNSHADNTSWVGDTASTPAKAVWNSQYVAVYHLAETSGTTYYDSTTNVRNLTKTGTITPTTGVVGGGQNFEGVGGNDYATWSGTLTPATWTVSFWENTDDTPTTIEQAVGLSTATARVGIYTYNAASPYRWGERTAVSTYRDAGTTLSPYANWYYLATVSRTVTTPYIYFYKGLGSSVSFTADGTSTSAGAAMAGRIRLGQNGYDTTTSTSFDGTLDEVRITNAWPTGGTGSTYWFQAEYYSLKDDLGAWSAYEQYVIPPTVATNALSYISTYTAVANGNITHTGGVVTQRGFEYGLTETDTWHKYEPGTWTIPGSYSLELTGLSPEVTYKLRAYAINSAGQGNGTWTTFATSAIAEEPVENPIVITLQPGDDVKVSTLATTSINSTWVIPNGSITAVAGTYIIRGFKYGKTQTPTWDWQENGSWSSGNGTVAYAGNLTGLDPSTLYYVQAYATTSTTGRSPVQQPRYGDWGNFTTEAGEADIANLPVSHSYGIVSPGLTYWGVGGLTAPSFVGGLSDGNCTGNVTNNSLFAIKVSFSMGNMTGGTTWVIGASPGTNIFRMRLYISGATDINDYTALSAISQVLIDSLGAGLSEYWEPVLDTPSNNPFSDGFTKTGTITLAGEAL